MNRSERNGSSPLLFGLVVFVLTFAAMYVRSLPPAPLPADAPPESFSASRALAVLESLVGDGEPHPIGTEANARVRRRLVDAFRSLGYATEVQSTFACSGTDDACSTVSNVVASRPGQGNGLAVMLVSHYDSVAAGPGASDAGVSAAAVVEIARALASDSAHRNPVAFLLTDGEEAGLIGASGFVADHPLARRLGAVINLEARGTSGPSVMFETSGENAWLVELLSRSLARPFASSLFYPIYERLPNDTDLTVFKQAGIPGVNFAFIGDVARYHSPLDDIAHADPATVQHHGDNALAIARALADADLELHRPGHAVFFDVLGFGIAWWPIGWTVPLAVASAALIILVTLLSWRSRESSPGRTLVGLFAWLLAIGASALATWRLLDWLLDRGAWPGGATTQPHLAVLAFWMVGVAVALLAAAVAARWSRTGGAWSGGWLGWSAASIGAALYFPEASYVLIVPTLVAGTLALVPVAVLGRSPGSIACALPIAAAGLLLMPAAWMLVDALGPTALPVVGTVMAVVATGLAPLVARGRRLKWTLPVAALGAAAVLSWMSFRAPAFSTESPERMSIAFFQLADGSRARWIVSPQSGVLPVQMREAAPFGTERAAGFPWSRASTAYVAETTPTSLREPSVDVVDRQARDGHTAIRLRAVSPRGASAISLLLPPHRIVSASMNGIQIPARPAEARVGLAQREAERALSNYTCFTVPAAGVEIELVVSGTAPVEGYILDVSRGLPAEGDGLLRARPDEAAPNGQGDVTILARVISF